MAVITRYQARKLKETCPSPSPIKYRPRTGRLLPIEESSSEEEEEEDAVMNDNDDDHDNFSYDDFVQVLIAPNFQDIDCYKNLYLSRLGILKSTRNPIISFFLHSESIYYDKMRAVRGRCELCLANTVLKYHLHNGYEGFYLDLNCYERFTKARRVTNYIKESRNDMKKYLENSFDKLNAI